MTSETSTKLCCVCLKMLPATEANFYINKKSGGWMSKCRPCRADICKRYRKTNGTAVRSAYGEAHREQAAAHSRAYRARDPEAKKISIGAWREKNPRKVLAQTTLRNAIRHGEVKRHPCFICGERAEGHHPDYDEPLSVVWLCRLHHAAAHKLAADCSRTEGVKG